MSTILTEIFISIKTSLISSECLLKTVSIKCDQFPHCDPSISCSSEVSDKGLKVALLLTKGVIGYTPNFLTNHIRQSQDESQNSNSISSSKLAADKVKFTL